MADHRRNYDEGPRRHERDWSDRPGDEGRSWFGDDPARPRNDEWRGQPYPDNHREDRGSRWEGPPAGDAGPREDRDHGYYPTSAFGAYRTDDRPYHHRYRTERYRDDAARSSGPWNRPRYSSGQDAADEYFRAAREQREEFQRYEAGSPGAEFEEHDHRYNGAPSWARERGGYWRQYEGRSPYAGRGPKDYRRSDERVREEVCDRMTDDPMLDASEISVQVSEGVVTLSGSVASRDQKRRAEDVAERISGVKDVTNQLRVAREANGHTHTATRPVTQSFEGTPSKSSSTTT